MSGEGKGGRVNWHWVRRGAVVAAIVAFLLFRDQLPDFNLEEIVEDLSQGLGKWTYLLVGALAFLETGAFVGQAPRFGVVRQRVVLEHGELHPRWFAAIPGI